uniref:Uncharacterized protein n=1 Tax=Anguilla anguilla TaxID=7936 RepID=A0A0E9Y050_ANGAN
MTAEDVVKQLEQEYEDVQFDVFEKTDKMAKSISRLQEIALRPDPLSTPGYIELLIEAEKQECKPGYKNRVAELQNVLEAAVIVNKVAKGEPLTDQEHKMGFFSRIKKWGLKLGLQIKK